MNMETIGESLKEIREKNEKSVYDIERDIGIKHQSLYNWEKGKQEPSILMCYKLAEYYGVSLDYLIGKSDKETKKGNKYTNNVKDNHGTITYNQR